MKLIFKISYERDRSEYHEKMSSYSCYLPNSPRNYRVLNIEFDSEKQTDQQDRNYPDHNHHYHCKKKCNYNRNYMQLRTGPLSSQSIFEILLIHMYQNYHHF